MLNTQKYFLGILFALLSVSPQLFANNPKQIAGIYPHLTMFNAEGECGTGAVVQWANRLWVITYGPHKPLGSSDKLYEITTDLKQIIRPESVGGTSANRMIHRESEQLNIGPYLINTEGRVRVLSPPKMPGRLTGSARHLSDPKNKIHIATMEEGLYSVDVDTLEVTEHIQDGNRQKAVGDGLRSKLPGYHGKGLYSGQGLLVYANNGEVGEKASKFPDTPSGALASWQGLGDWKLIRRNQFTEVSGPGGIYGNSNPDKDPIWALGWDHRSLILMVLVGGNWHAYRLPKASHSYDGAHGWNTEWPRIRDIGEEDLLATMHGTFWRFPKSFSTANSAGIAPRSNYMKVIGDFARWNDKIVFGCDDSAQKEFLNHRAYKSPHCAPIQSNSNLWFVNPERIDQLGPSLGRGSVWLNEDLQAGDVSDPFLFSGYDYRTIAIRHKTEIPVTFSLEIDRVGNGQWSKLQEFKVKDSLIYVFPESINATWIRLKPNIAAKNVVAHFHFRKRDNRTIENDSMFAPICRIDTAKKTGGMIRSNRRVLSLLSSNGSFELDQSLELSEVNDNSELFENATQPMSNISVDAASAIVKEDGKTYRIPENNSYLDISGRVCREVATERDLFNFHGTFYELPARNAGGFAKLRPIATHNLAIDDYASHFGLLFVTGLNEKTNERVIRSKGGRAAVWAGVIDDLWKLGKPRGKGGPWKNSHVEAGSASDPYLMTGYDKKSVRLEASQKASITIEVDVDGTGIWIPYETFNLKANKPVTHSFPKGFSAYWVRTISDTSCQASATFVYE